MMRSSCDFHIAKSTLDVWMPVRPSSFVAGLAGDKKMTLGGRKTSGLQVVTRPWVTEFPAALWLAGTCAPEYRLPPRV